MAETPAESADAQAATQSVVEVSHFANYLRRVVPVLLEDVEDTPAALVAALKERSSIEMMKKFISDSQVPVMFVQRMATKGNIHNHNQLTWLVCFFHPYFS